MVTSAWAISACAGTRVGDSQSGFRLYSASLIRNVEIQANGFAAESENLDEYAQGKRSAKKLPLVVGNLLRHGLGGDENTIVMFDDEGRHPLGPAPKIEIARGIVAHIGQMLAGNGE